MTTSLQLSEHLEGLRSALVAMVRSAERAGLRAPVPTTPDWTVRRLVAHQGMVHRWAAAVVRGEVTTGADRSASDWEQEGIDAPDVLEWLRDGAIEIVTAIATAPPDLDALVFLADAPRPREFWARRQCHETTVHAVDALSAELGRYPRAADAAWITPAVALDGIDELLTGFLPRPRTRLRAEEPQRVAVRPTGSDVAWVIDVSDRPPVTTRVTAPAADGDTVLDGDPVALYLTLWNRSDEIAPGDGWSLWRDGAQVRWA